MRVPVGKVQPRFKLYMKAKDLKPGDNFEGHDFINWISVYSTTYKKKIGSDTIHDQDNFTHYINDCLSVGRS